MFFNLLKIKTKQAGESLLEVIIAVLIFTIVLTGTYMLLNRAVAMNTDIRNRLIALNIAREGIEAVRNIRDTNWLKYSGDKRNKWFCTETSSNDCTITNETLLTVSSEKYYTVDFDNTKFRYFWEEITGATELGLEAPMSTNASDFQLYKSNSLNRFTHDPTDNSLTPFYRQLELVVVNPFEDTVAYDAVPEYPIFCDNQSLEPTCYNAKLKVISRVKWRENAIEKRLLLEAHLFDYYDRNEY